MLNLLYCFDANYNFQAFTSMFSILKNTSNQVNIYIIHQNETNFEFIPKKILNHKNLSEINVYKFENKNYEFPNIEGTHVSEATYYRIFLEDYLHPSVNEIVYLDADIVCVNDPYDLLINEVNNLKKSTYVISSKTEHLRKDSPDNFLRLGMKSEKYFNAGVMIIDLKKWKKQDVKNKTMKILSKSSDSLKFWDQDLLNISFDGNYKDLKESFNKVIDLASYEYLNYSVTEEEYIKDICLVHYAGSHKPWNINGILCNLSEFYQTNYRFLMDGHYHITHKMKRLSIFYLLKSFINLEFFKTKQPLRLFRDFVNSLI